MKTLKAALLGAALAFSFSVSDAQAVGLEGELTPTGAIRAGNADGTIPAWTGGITVPPPGFQPGDHHPDPFPNDQPYLVIDASNMAQYADKLTPGQMALMEKYPSFRMNVYPTRRTFSAPQRIYDESIANDARARLTADGNGVEGAREGVPFPTPEVGVEAVWNHILRWRGVSSKRTVGQVNPTAGGAYTYILIEEDIYLPYHQVGGTDSNTFAYFLQEVKAPARLAGEILLVHETLNQVAERREAWTYNPGQRRVRRAPNVAYDNPGTASDGQRTTDNFDIFNGSPDRYNWELVGRKEMFVPYNSYKMHAEGIPTDELVMAGHLNPDYKRYELHRVWVVEGTLKEGTSHIYAKRTFYIDEDSWQILTADHYDGRGQLWRVAEAHPINYYEVPAFWSTMDVLYDLQSGRYTALGFDNNQPMYDYTVSFNEGDFTPDQLRRRGRR